MKVYISYFVSLVNCLMKGSRCVLVSNNFFSISVISNSNVI